MKNFKVKLLKQLERGNYKKVFDSLSFFLPPDSQYFDLVTSLRVRYHRVRDEDLKGILTRESLRLEYNQINDALISIINSTAEEINSRLIDEYIEISEEVDFKLIKNFDKDIESNIEIISNPITNESKLFDLFRKINISIFNHICERINITGNIKNEIIKTYERKHRHLFNMFYDDLINSRENEPSLYDEWYEEYRYKSLTNFSECFKKNISFYISHVFATVIKTAKLPTIFNNGKRISLGGIGLNEIFNPLIKKVKIQAAINDFSLAKGLLNLEVTKEISELCTYEIRDRKGLNKEIMAKILGIPFQKVVTEISAISIMKIGIDLNSDIDFYIDGDLLVIELPEPKILTHEVYPKFDNFFLAWSGEFKVSHLNKMLNELRVEFRRVALENNCFEISKTKTESIINQTLIKLLKKFNLVFKVKIRFSRKVNKN